MEHRLLGGSGFRWTDEPTVIGMSSDRSASVTGANCSVASGAVRPLVAASSASAIAIALG